MRIDGSNVLHLILDVASDEFLRSWAINWTINNVFERKWYKLLNLETGRIDVWPETDVRINVDRSL